MDATSHGEETKVEEAQEGFLVDVHRILRQVRNVQLQVDDAPNRPVSFVADWDVLSSALKENGFSSESEVLRIVSEKALESKEDGGLGLSTTSTLRSEGRQEVLFLLESWLESLNSHDRYSSSLPLPLRERRPETRPMTLTEKILAHHAVTPTWREGVKAGDVLMIAVDWVITSEAGWFAMRKIFAEMNETQIWRNDRFWIAGDHVVDPRIMHDPQVQALVQASEQAKVDFKLTEYQGMNFTIMHTEFVRQRAQPGMIVVGADSHTCSSGAVGCLAVGLGAADVVIPLATGQTWFKVPESILIYLVGKPAFGIGGKDVILHILGELKRNTVAASKVVEFSGPGASSLSIDARFAISNMCTEFGAITGIFVPDEITYAYMRRRKRQRYKSTSLFFRPDEQALYSARYTIDLSHVQPTIALYPSPDNVVPVGEKTDMMFDGVFIGACTTTEEDLILAALILKVGLAKGLKPVRHGKRHVVPGSMPIIKNLKRLGFVEIFQAAGFTIGIPGCSYCVGMGADKADKGERWLSSQNRNFANRMGPGSFGNITSAAVVAASSFNMTLTDPRPLEREIDQASLDLYLGYNEQSGLLQPDYVEPCLGAGGQPILGPSTLTKPPGPSPETTPMPAEEGSIKSKVINLGDFVDTDALAPAEYLMSAKDDEELGRHCMEHVYHEFRSLVRGGQRVVVGGKAFGCGSSREQAVRALKGLGVQAVIARSFSFIYGRNQPSLGLLGIQLDNDDFFRLAVDQADIEIDVAHRLIRLAGRTFDFHLDEMEYRLTVNKGLQASYKKFGRDIWNYIGANSGRPRMQDIENFPMLEEKQKRSGIDW